MKSRFIVVGVILSVFLACRVSQSPAEKIFGTVWLENYVAPEAATSPEDDWAADAKKAKCYLCHVKGKSKKYCNTYGDALAEWLDSDHFEKDRVEAEEGLVKGEIRAALKRAEAVEDTCGTPFGALFESGKLPNSELGARSAAKEMAAESGDEEEVEEPGN